MEEIKEQFIKFIPNNEVRNYVLKLYAKIIEKSHNTKQNNWNVCYRKGEKRFQLNCGNKYVLLVTAKYILVMCNREDVLSLGEDFINNLLTKVEFQKEESTLAKVGLLTPKNFLELEQFPADALWHNTFQFRIGHEDIFEFLPSLEKSIIKFAEWTTLDRPLLSASKSAHSQDFINYLNLQLGTNIPQPEYVKKDIIKTWQEIYDESLKNKNTNNKYFETINIIRENVGNVHWTDDCIYRVLKSSKNGISTVNWGQLSNVHYDVLKENWNFYEEIFNKIYNEKTITQETFEKIKNKTQLLTGKNYSLILNRAICGLLSGVMTSAPDVDFFYERLNLIKDVFPEIPEITGNWLNDNLTFVSYCKEQVNFQEEHHASGFIFDLFDYCKNLTSQGESQMQNPQEKLINETKTLLENTKNLILTGAPGTGKTFLAKQIAKEMGCEKDEIGFVQFHPSYDYTDFVEGLRPIQNDGNNQIGFERKDGVFKEFCAKAKKNLVDSKKTVEEISSEKNIEAILENFVNESKEQKTEFELVKTGNKFIISEKTNEKFIYIDIPNNAKVTELPISYDEILSILNSGKVFSTVKDVYSFFERKWGTQQDSYIFAIYNELREKISANQNIEETKIITQKNFVFIIDEINRGEVSKIFGELFYCIDPGYRGEKGKISTQYQNIVTSGEFQKGFFIPENVYIIGTMNDIDRSVESMDFAFRRRFAWKEITADDTQYMLDEVEKDGVIYGLSSDIAEEAKERMDRLNDEISKVPELNSAYHIGASYFLKLKNYEGDSDNGFQSLWNYHLKGILEEYLRGNPAKEDLMKKLKAAYDGEDVTNEG